MRTCEVSTITGMSFPGPRHELVDFKKWDPFSKDLSKVPLSRFLGLSYVWSSLKVMVDSDQTELNRAALAHNSEALAQARRACYDEEHWTETHPLILYWAVIIRTYASTELTRTSDRLIAIAGLAKILSSRTGIRFVAGHWMYQLPRQILWFSLDLKTVEHDDQYIAPSWSWALRPVGVIWNMRLAPPLEQNGAMDLIKILDVNIEVSRGDEMQ